MRVLQVCNYSADYPGNFIAGLTSLQTAAAKAQEPFELLFAFPLEARDRYWAKELEKSHRVIYFPFNKMKWGKQLARICRREKIDVMHTHFCKLFCLFLPRLFSNTKIVYHLHNDLKKSGALRDSIRSASVALFPDLMVGCSEEVMNSMLRLGFSKKKCRFVTNRVDFSRLDLTSGNKEAESGRSLLIFGTDFLRKGCDLTIEALAPIAREKNVTLNIVTHNFENSRQEIAKLPVDITDRVKLVKPSNNIGDYYRSSAIFLSPSRSEGLSYAVPEAMYCGVPVIKSDIRNLQYGLKNEDAITVPLDAIALRDRIVEFLDMDEQKRRAMTDDFREQVIREYDISNWSRDILNLYKSLVNNAG